MYHIIGNGQRQIVGFLGPGDILGSLKSSEDAYCTAEALTDLETCAFDRSRFAEFLERHPDFGIQLLVVASDEIEAQYDHMALLARRTAAERVAAFLLEVYARLQPTDDGGSPLHLPMLRGDIADYLGLSIETVSRVLSQFNKRGWVELEKPKSIVLKNTAALMLLAGVERPHEGRIALGL